MTLAVVNGVDITKWIDKDTYKVNAEDIYESWQNANFVETRIFIRDRVSGKFDIRCGSRSTYADFLTNWNAATTNGVVTMGIYVQNKNQMKAVNAFFTFTGEEHYENPNGARFDRVTVEIEER